MFNINKILQGIYQCMKHTKIPERRRSKLLIEVLQHCRIATFKYILYVRNL